MQRAELIMKRKKMKLTQEEVARLAGISRTYYTNVEAGRRNPSIKNAKNIADAVKSTVDKIFFKPIVPKRNNDTLVYENGGEAIHDKGHAELRSM